MRPWEASLIPGKNEVARKAAMHAAVTIFLKLNFILFRLLLTVALFCKICRIDSIPVRCVYSKRKKGRKLDGNMYFLCSFYSIFLRKYEWETGVQHFLFVCCRFFKKAH
jgi:hypothetical protein